MPTNKNALIRYKYLDKLLSDYHHFYDIHDLTEKVNDMLYEDGFSEVTQRCIEKDLNTLEYAPFSAPIERFTKNGKRCIAYSKRSFSIFTKELSDEEAILLREVLNTIGQFDGLDNFKWLDDFKIGLGLEERRQIISFSNNPYLQNSNLLGTLFDQISNKVVIRLSYHTFNDETIRSIDFHPYLLKQYNERWFLLGAVDSDQKILNFALDRIDKVEPLPEKKYIECPDDIFERFENIVGVTLYEERQVEHHAARGQREQDPDPQGFFGPRKLACADVLCRKRRHGLHKGAGHQHDKRTDLFRHADTCGGDQSQGIHDGLDDQERDSYQKVRCVKGKPQLCDPQGYGLIETQHFLPETERKVFSRDHIE